MRILWFSVTPSLFIPRSNGHNGGGWVASLERIVRQEETVELGVAFQFDDSTFRHDRDGVAYYPIKQVSDAAFLRIIDDFKPQLIQIFGSENAFGRICRLTHIPVVIHMQGCLPAYHNALFPIDMGPLDFLTHRGLDWRRRYMGLRSKPAFLRNAEREIATIQSCHYFMGRTAWDHALVDLFNPSARYFHCEEALRPSFLKADKCWTWHEHGGRKRIVSVISRPWYKGCDLILKTARLLRRFTDIDFEWRVYGIPEMHFFEHKYGIRAVEVGVQAMGTASQEQLVEALVGADCYVHPSYIDNSPNSVCEAQILGLPVLATHVGGIGTLVEDGKSGRLFPANDPYMLASLLKQVLYDRSMAETISQGARQKALLRHDPETIRRTLTRIYKEIIDENNH